MQQEQRNAAARAAAAGSPSTADNAATPSSATNAATPGAPSTAPSAAGSTTAPPPGQMIGPNGQLVPQPRHPWDYVDEIILTQKTAWPLLTLSMEYFCDAIQTRFKPVPDEDIYRLVTALLNDAIGQYVHRAVVPDDDGSLPQATASNVARVAANVRRRRRCRAKIDPRSSSRARCTIRSRRTLSPRGPTWPSTSASSCSGAIAASACSTASPSVSASSRPPTGSSSTSTTSLTSSRCPASVRAAVTRSWD